MKTAIQSLLIIGIALCLFGFKSSSHDSLIGTYGVCASDPAAIELVLMENNTFSYQDYSIPERPVNISGHWKLKNNKVFLQNSDTDLSFHAKWKISGDGMVAQSRNGLTFYRLVKKS